MKRKIDRYLKQWKTEPNRKVLLLRGARQVGKTYSIRTLGKSFKNFLEVNFEEEQPVTNFFNGSLNPHEITKKLSVYFNTAITPNETLLFFDEIQACSNALKSLRFFYEKMPNLHLVAAGSLLEFTLEEIPSFGVGRITSLYMYPISFSEFVRVLDGAGLANIIDKKIDSTPIDTIFHKKLLELLKNYLITGGMPAIVKYYAETDDLVGTQQYLDELITTIQDDFAKYKKRISSLKIRDTLNSIVYQAGGKFKYSNISSTEPQAGYKKALNLLVQAGVAHIVYHTAAQGLPLGAQIKSRKFKILFFDIGISQRILGMDLRQYIVKEISEIVNNGALIEQVVGLELISSFSPFSKPQLYYWHREAKSSNAEIDYIIQKNENILPIEVKAGKQGSMQSMYQFIKEKKSKIALRFSQENCSKFNNVTILPIYLASRVLNDDFRIEN